MIRMLPVILDETSFCLYEDEKLLSKCVYDPKTGEIFRIDSFDPAAASLNTALLKVVMSSLEYAGVAEAWSVNPDLFEVLKTLRFQTSEDRMAVSLKGYFDHACECRTEV